MRKSKTCFLFICSTTFSMCDKILFGFFPTILNCFVFLSSIFYCFVREKLNEKSFVFVLCYNIGQWLSYPLLVLYISTTFRYYKYNVIINRVRESGDGWKKVNRNGKTGFSWTKTLQIFFTQSTQINNICNQNTQNNEKKFETRTNEKKSQKRIREHRDFNKFHSKHISNVHRKTCQLDIKHYTYIIIYIYIQSVIYHRKCFHFCLAQFYFQFVNS